MFYGINTEDKHAEIDVLNNCFRKLSKINKKDKFDIAVVRINRSGEFKNSKPCYHCIEYMKSCGLQIENVYYSDSNGDLICEKLSVIENDYVTAGNR